MNTPIDTLIDRHGVAIVGGLRLVLMLGASYAAYNFAVVWRPVEPPPGMTVNTVCYTRLLAIECFVPKDAS